MSNSKSDKPLVRNWIIGCVITILIFHFAWAKYLIMNYHRSVFFTVVDIVLFLAFGIGAFIAYENADDPNKDTWRKEFIWLAVISCIWAAAWSTGLMNNLDQGI
jgi:hypothetical protein